MDPVEKWFLESESDQSVTDDESDAELLDDDLTDDDLLDEDPAPSSSRAFLTSSTAP